ncbi:hypothetical protein [Methanolapillus ohkumae]|uniref:CcmD family protein n=1 Tax=Methanolapillus ohkumae TaxID=3028298 RepID=A0AA96V8B0_9EURY|nr:hypothetical protein MsAm2_14910 [Methanosarcinaceae archaeon Am2]
MFKNRIAAGLFVLFFLILYLPSCFAKNEQCTIGTGYSLPETTVHIWMAGIALVVLFGIVSFLIKLKLDRMKEIKKR